MKKSYRPFGIAMLVALIGTCAVSPISCAYYGHHRAQSLCDETVIGSSIDDFRDRARRRVDMVMDMPDRSGAASATRGRAVAQANGFVFLRYFCEVEYVDNKITEKKVTSLD